MKKLKHVILGIALSGMLISACGNVQLIDTTFTFNYAYIDLPNGECVEGLVRSWRDYENGDQLQITIGNDTYLTDTTRAVLVYKGEVSY